MSPWVWFVIAGVAAAAGTALLAIDHRCGPGCQRERRRWAALRGWRFMPSDPVLAQRWRHGVIARGDPGMAKDVVVGSLFTPLGRRWVRVFDYEHGGQTSHAVVAMLRRVHAADLVVELWLSDQPLPQDPPLVTLGPVGDRVAVTTDPEQTSTLVTPELVFACDAVGADIPVLWWEKDWVLAAAPVTATPARLERLLRALNEITDLLDTTHREEITEPAREPW